MGQFWFYLAISGLHILVVIFCVQMHLLFAVVKGCMITQAKLHVSPWIACELVVKAETESCQWDSDTNSPFKLIQIPLAVLMISINEIFLPVTSNAEPAMRWAVEAARLLSHSVT